MPLRYIPALVITIALIFSTLYAYKRESSYIEGMAVAEGVVTELGSRSKSSVTINGTTTKTNTQALVDFEVNGTVFRAEGRAAGYPLWEVGSKVPVYYSVNNPDKARINRFDEVYFFTLISAFFLICCLLFAFINFLVYKIRGKPLS